jgi:ribosomal protein S18 acetylase RimI-like enzyme
MLAMATAPQALVASRRALSVLVPALWALVFGVDWVIVGAARQTVVAQQAQGTGICSGMSGWSVFFSFIAPLVLLGLAALSLPVTLLAWRSSRAPSAWKVATLLANVAVTLVTVALLLRALPLPRHPCLRSDLAPTRAAERRGRQAATPPREIRGLSTMQRHPVHMLPYRLSLVPHTPPLLAAWRPISSMTSGIQTRMLVEDDAPSARALRLRALLDAPDSFLSSHDTEAAQPVAATVERLRQHDRIGTGVLGAFQDGVLVGTLFMARESHRKAAHRANLGGMYVAPEARSRGIGRALIDAAVDRLRALGVEQVHLYVATTADAARRLYRRAGFEVVGTLREAMKDGERYVDEDLMVLRL